MTVGGGEKREWRCGDCGSRGRVVPAEQRRKDVAPCAPTCHPSVRIRKIRASSHRGPHVCFRMSTRSRGRVCFITHKNRPGGTLRKTSGRRNRPHAPPQGRPRPAFSRCASVSSHATSACHFRCKGNNAPCFCRRCDSRFCCCAWRMRGKRASKAKPEPPRIVRTDIRERQQRTRVLADALSPLPVPTCKALPTIGIHLPLLRRPEKPLRLRILRERRLPPHPNGDLRGRHRRPKSHKKRPYRKSHANVHRYAVVRKAKAPPSVFRRGA